MKTKILPINNNVMFKFLDYTGGKKGRFHDTHRSGIILVPSATSQHAHRWGEVIAVGPKVDGVKKGDYILIEALMWMNACDPIDGVTMWKTDDSKILVVTDDIDECWRQ